MLSRWSFTGLTLKARLNQDFKVNFYQAFLVKSGKLNQESLVTGVNRAHRAFYPAHDTRVFLCMWIQMFLLSALIVVRAARVLA